MSETQLAARKGQLITLKTAMERCLPEWDASLAGVGMMLAGLVIGLERLARRAAPARVAGALGGLCVGLLAARAIGIATAWAEAGDPRVRLADWLTDPSNPWFARLVANRLWKHFLGRGLVEPEDDLRSTNPATNEPLLDLLTRQVVENRYDLKAMMRLILNSRVYQLTADPNDTNRDDEQNFSHHYVRRIPAEVLLDAISEVTGSPEAFPGRPRGTRAIELWDNRLPSYFLDTFGRSERTSPCECGRSGEPTMAQALHLMNAPEVSAKVANPTGRITRLLQTQPPMADAALIEELTLAALGRLPTEKERHVARELFGKAARRDAAEDYLWTLLNSYDFLFVR